MQIERIKCRRIGFSRAPVTLKRNLVSNASLFEYFGTKPRGWVGRVMCTLGEVESDDGIVGFGTAGAFHGGAKSLIDDYYSELLIGDDPRRHEYLWQRMYRTTVPFGRSRSAMTAISALDIAGWDLQRFGFGPKDGRVCMKRNADLVRTVRDAVGDDVNSPRAHIWVGTLDTQLK